MKLFFVVENKNKNFNQNPLERRRDTSEEEKNFFSESKRHSKVLNLTILIFSCLWVNAIAKHN
jgi:hypothetical protein